MTRRTAALLVCLATLSLAQGQTQDPGAAPPPAASDASQAVPAAPACLTCGGSGQDEPSEWTDLPLSERETLTNDWFGLGAKLRDEGIEVALSLTQIYQINLHGGLSTHRRSGRYAGSYDLETLLDMDTLAGLPGGSVYMLAEGSWSDGLDPSSVGSLLGVNADAAGDEAANISQLWYEQAMLGDRLCEL